MLRLSSLSFALLLSSTFSSTLALPTNAERNLLDFASDLSILKSPSSHSSLLSSTLSSTAGSSHSLLDFVSSTTLGNSKDGKHALLLTDLDAAVLSAEKGLLDATATVKAAGEYVADVVVKSGRNALIDLDVLGTLLGPQQCTGNAVIGLQAEVSVGKLLHLCVCVEVLSLSSTNKKACPSCPANADPICGSGECGCKCRDGFFADPSLGCLPIKTCTSSGGHLRRSPSGTSTCQCPSPFRLTPSGGCALPPSARAHRRSRQLALPSSSSAMESVAGSREGMTVDGDEQLLKCPVGERACPVPGGNGGEDEWECLDVSSELSSCGGCPGERASVDCLALPGVANVGCVNSRCVVGSCFPGYRYLAGRCVRTSRD
ncbi:hypothetical protein JCM8547_005711 [Rhodosporidiobolus lusitaniae]